MVSLVPLGELRRFFGEDEDLADYFVTEIDGYARHVGVQCVSWPHTQFMTITNMTTCDVLFFICCRYRQDAWDLTAADDGQITLDEWYSFIDYLGDKNKVR